MADESPKPKLVVSAPAPTPEDTVSIAKPDDFDLEAFRVKAAPTIAGVDTLQTALPHHKIADARDFVRLHSDPAYWSPELCFVTVPVKGLKNGTLHLITEEVATQYLPSAKIQKFRLALGCKPDGSLFLCHVPTRNLEHSWNASNLEACEQAKTLWTQATSRKAEGVEAYKIDVAREEVAFVAPAIWTTQTLNALISITFAGCQIKRADHPGLLRLIGGKPPLS